MRGHLARTEHGGSSFYIYADEGAETPLAGVAYEA